MQRVRERSSQQEVTSERLQSQEQYDDIESAVKAWEKNVSEKAKEMEDQIADKVCEVSVMKQDYDEMVIKLKGVRKRHDILEQQSLKLRNDTEIVRLNSIRLRQTNQNIKEVIKCDQNDIATEKIELENRRGIMEEIIAPLSSLSIEVEAVVRQIDEQINELTVLREQKSLEQVAELDEVGANVKKAKNNLDLEKNRLHLAQREYARISTSSKATIAEADNLQDHLNNERYRLNQIRGQIERIQKEITIHEEKLSVQEKLRDTFLLRKDNFQSEHAKKIEALKAKNQSEVDNLEAESTALKSKKATVDQLYENRVNEHNEKEQEVAANKLAIEQLKHEQSKLDGQYMKQRAVLDEVLVKVKILTDHMNSRLTRYHQDQSTLETDVQTLTERKEKVETLTKLGAEMEEKIKLMETQDIEISERIAKARIEADDHEEKLELNLAEQGECEETIKRVERQLIQLTGGVTAKEDHIKYLKNSITDAEEAINQLEREVAKIDFADVESELAKLNAEIEENDLEIGNFNNTRIDWFEKQLDLQNEIERMESIEQDFKELDEEFEKQNEEIKKKKTYKRTAKGEKTRMASKIKTQQKKVDVLKKSAKNLEKKVEELAEKSGEELETIEEVEEEKLKLEEEIDKIRLEIENLEEEASEQETSTYQEKFKTQMEKILDDLELNIQSKEAILLNAASALEKKVENQAEIEKLEEEVVELKKSIEKIKQVKELEQSILKVSKLKRKRESPESSNKQSSSKRESKSKVKVYVEDKFSIPTNPKFSESTMLQELAGPMIASTPQPKERTSKRKGLTIRQNPPPKQTRIHS